MELTSRARLREYCNETVTCIGEFVFCTVKGYCSCSEGYAPTTTTHDCAEIVIQKVEPPGTDPTMIGVVVGLALMSVTLCVVMRLFAKARFTENRTIFNTANPRLMNVSLKAGRKNAPTSDGGKNISTSTATERKIDESESMAHVSLTSPSGDAESGTVLTNP